MQLKDKPSTKKKLLSSEDSTFEIWDYTESYPHCTDPVNSSK